MAILEVKDLKMHYQTKTETVRAVEDVSFSVNEGETFGLVGESGCGKSATCRTIAHLLPETGKVLNGSVMFGGKDLVTLSEKEMTAVRGEGISMIFQEPMTALNPVLTIQQQLYETMKRQKLSKAEMYNRAIELLRLVDIPEPERRMKQYIHQFSGGMRQRAMIAIALAANPHLLLADEPTTALDVTIQHQIIRLLNQLKKELHMSVILVTHDLGVVRQMCDTVAVMYAGYIVETGACSEVLDNPAHPYTTGLIRSLPKDKDDRARLDSIQGLPPDLSEEIVGCPFAPRCSRCTELCQREMPAVHDLGGGRSVRCHHAEAVKRGDDANV